MAFVYPPLASPARRLIPSMDTDKKANEALQPLSDEANDQELARILGRHLDRGARGQDHQADDPFEGSRGLRRLLERELSTLAKIVSFLDDRGVFDQTSRPWP